MNRFFVIIIVLLTLCSCGASKQLTQIESTDNTAATTSTVETRTVASYSWSDNAFNPLTAISAASSWTDFSANGSIALTGAGSLRSSVQVKMSRGRFISISLRPILGIEMGKLYIDSDSLIVIDKYHNIYVQEDISKLAGSDGAGLIALQNMLLARPFDIAAGDIPLRNLSRYQATTPDSDGRWTLTPPADYAAFTYAFQMLANNVANVDVQVAGRDNYQLQFSDMRTTDGLKSPGKIQADLTLQGTDVGITIEMNKSIRWNSGLTDTVHIPSDARRYTLSQVIKSLTK